MRISQQVTLIAITLSALALSANAFSTAGRAFSRKSYALGAEAEVATMAESGVPPATSDASDVSEEAVIPTNLPSDVGMDYVPLATMLATGQLAEADQVRQSRGCSIKLCPLSL